MSKATPRSIWTNPLHFIAFGFGSGAAPVAPGTFGTVAAIPIYLFIYHYPLWLYSLLLLIGIVLGCWIIDITERDIGEHDHKGIVWDEVVGYLLTMLAAPHGWRWVLLGFILFRLFDIWKPWPISWMDKHIKGGVGTVVDDLAAAVPAWIIMQLLAWMFHVR